MSELTHWGVLGMKWGVRRAKDNVLKPTYQYRDSQGNLVSRYGKGPYGGGPKPTNKGDSKFYKTANKMVPKLRADGLLKKASKRKLKDSAPSAKTKEIAKKALSKRQNARIKRVRDELRALDEIKINNDVLNFKQSVLTGLMHM